MKVLIYSHAFAPQVGGVETFVMALARGLTEWTNRHRAEGQDGAGVQVTVVTASTRCDFDDQALPFTVVRRPRIQYLFTLIRMADVVHLTGPCLLPLFLGLILRKRTVVEHHGFQTICP